MSTSNASPYRLRVLGTPDLRAPDGRRVGSVLSQPKRLGLLTYLALSPGPVSRASVVATFWPESDEAKARNALSQAVFYLRRSLREDVIESVEGDRLWAPPERLWCDAREILAATPGAATVEAGGGDLLEGWNADESQPLQEWLDTLRRKLRAQAEALETSRVVGSAAGPATAVDAPGGQEPTRADQGVTHTRSALVRRRPPVWFWLTGVAAAAAAAAFLVGPRLRPSPPPADAIDLAVLMPRVLSTPDAPELSAQAIDDELLAHLPEVAGLRIREASYAGSLGDFRRQLSVIGAPSGDAPEWILDVSVRATRAEARVVGVLYRSPAFDVLEREGFEVTYGSPDAVLLDAPQEIARGVVGIVEEALAREAR
jgi:hypothetical protein